MTLRRDKQGRKYVVLSFGEPWPKGPACMHCARYMRGTKMAPKDPRTGAILTTRPMLLDGNRVKWTWVAFQCGSCGKTRNTRIRKRMFEVR